MIRCTYLTQRVTSDSRSGEEEKGKLRDEIRNETSNVEKGEQKHRAATGMRPRETSKNT